MASYSSSMNSAQPSNPELPGRGAAFGPIQSSVVANQGAPQQPIPGQSSPAAGSPGGSSGSVAPGAFPPGQVPPQLAQMLMGMDPNQPHVANQVPSLPGHAGGMGGGAFGGSQALGAPQTANSGAFGRMGGAPGAPSWASAINGR